MAFSIRYIIIIVTIAIFPLIAQAQFLDYGTDPARLKWNTVNTNHYKLIYPRGNDSMAYRYAVFLENARPHVNKTMQSRTTLRFPIILHSASMSSNGMVAWAPRRMELLTTPPPHTYPQSWDKQLVLHESRHVAQTGKLKQGIFSPLYYVIGEQSAGIAAFGIPKWFYEGDAVVAETALSATGRGREPEYDMVYAAQMGTQNFFSFDKWFLGSYKDYTGDFYALGYNLVAYARHAYGADVWDKVVDRYTKRIYAIPPFSNALKHYTGLTTKQLFIKTFAYRFNEWQTNDSIFLARNKIQTRGIPTRWVAKHPDYLSPNNKRYTSYKYPQVLNDSVTIALKSSLHDISSLVALQNGHEKHLCYVGSINSRINLNNNRVYWSEYVPSLRWTHENYSVVKYYDIQTKRIVTLTPRQRYLSPTVDANGQKIAVSQFSSSGESSITLLDAGNGKVISNFKVHSNAFVKEMVFDDNNIIANVIGDKGLSILQLDTENGDWYGLLKPTKANITNPTIHNGKLYFESGLGGINNIYSFDTRLLQTQQLTFAQYGAFSPTLSTDGEKLVYTDYQAKGHKVATVNLDSIKPVTVDFTISYKYPLAETVSEQESINFDTVTLKPVDFKPKPYRRGLNLFNIHSWAPFYYNVLDAINLQADDFSSIIKPGVTILSQNALNTAITQLGWYYKDGYNYGKLAFIYMGWYPVISIDVEYGNKTFDLKWGKAEDNKITPYSYLTDKNLLEAEGKIYIPFNLTRNHCIRGFQPSVSYYYTNNRYQQYESGTMRDFQYMLSELRYYHYRKMAQRDILPRWGYQIRLQHLITPFDTENFGALYAARLTTYLPGFIRNDGLMLRFGYQYQDVDEKAFYTPKRLLDETRGYHYNYRTRQQFAFKADYAFNIACPDLAIGSLAYVKRLRANVFYDLTRNQMYENSGWATQSAYGADLIFDWNAFRLNYPLSLGVRVIKPIDYGNVQAEALFSIAF